MTAVAGVDGCPGGWVAARVADGGVEWLLPPDAAAVLALDAEVVGVDIPIGLPQSGRRACDVAARALLGPRRASVLPAPARAVLDATSYAEARRRLAALGGPSMSAQAWGLVPRVRDVDRVLSPADERRVVEVHPELAFRLLAGRDLPSKHTTAGQEARVAALRAWLPKVGAALARVPRPARTDDALDALAVAWSARRWHRGVALVLPDGDTERDARGLAMRIVA